MTFWIIIGVVAAIGVFALYAYWTKWRKTPTENGPLQTVYLIGSCVGIAAAAVIVAQILISIFT